MKKIVFILVLFITVFKGNAQMYYLDSDHDGAGNSSVWQTQPVNGFVTNSCDLNDSDPCVTCTQASTIRYYDFDGDGFGNGIVYCNSVTAGKVNNNFDCDDSNAAINPNTRWYIDNDGDGYGNSLTFLTQCSKPVGYVLNNTDCNDASNLVNNPNTTWYLDSDGDGYGSSTVLAIQCNQPTNGVLNNLDCNDANVQYNVLKTWFDDSDLDGLGDPNSTIISCQAPSGFVANNSDLCPGIYGSYSGCIIPALSPSGSNDKNYIISVTPKSPVISLAQITNSSNLNTEITYFDGLGRANQNIASMQSISGKDIITPIVYDAIGRQSKSYLPYVSTQNTLAFMDVNTVILNTTTQYQTNYGDTNPYSEKLFESSSLNRVLKQAAPGNDWKLGLGHEIKLDYQTNVANEVKLYIVALTFTNNTYSPTLSLSAANGGYYAANDLYKTITYDENSAAIPSETAGSTVEFKNKEGQVILKRTYGIAGSNIVNEAHDTYYVYDQYGNLTFVLPPLVTNITTQLNDLCYQYKYDYRNRLVEKKIPGKQWEFIVYDKLNRVVATGPASTPFTDLSLGWLITKYDVFNRVILTAWMPATTVTSADRINLQAARDIETTNFSETKTSTSTNVNNVVFRYSNNVWPTNLAAPATIYHVLTVNYYDDYDYPNPPVIPSTVLNQNVFFNVTNKPKGLTTGSWVRILEASTSSTTYAEQGYTLYDYKARPIRDYTTNFLGGFNKIENNLDFSGKLIYQVTSHKRAASSTALPDIKDDYTYSDQDRLLTIKQTIAGGVQQLIAANSYDDLGNLITKRVGNTELSPLQTIDYSYNIRGWLKNINDIATINVSGNTDLFASQIRYNDIADSSKKLYNGNISQTLWESANSDKTLKNYIYTYDALNRLKSATDNTTYFNEDNILYDKNGNITKLKRKGNLIANPSLSIPGNYGLMDDLTYTYDNGNKLQTVSDAGEDSYGFKDDFIGSGSDTTIDYTYDANGNMLTDSNKGITTNIAYNHLDLPTKIILPTGNIVYLYNALGQKVKKTVTLTSPLTTTITEYLGEFQYKKLNSGSSDLQFFPTKEGYVANNLGVFSYVFQYKDQLGNVRLSYDKNLQIVEENNYYPFGLKHQGYNNNPQFNYANAVAQNYKYNGKELQDELDLNITAMDWRQYDPTIGRFVSVDPMSEYMRKWSPYAFCFDNPSYYSDPTGLEGEDFAGKNKKKEATVNGGTLKEVVVKGRKKSSASVVVSVLWHGVDFIPFAGSIKQIGQGIYQGNITDVALGTVFLAVDFFTAGEGGAALRLAEVATEDAIKIAAKDEAKEIVEQNLAELAVTNGNSVLSEAEQHLYEIYKTAEDGTEEVVKTGVSGGKVAKNGKSYRATNQVNKWNKAEGAGKYKSRIKQVIPQGPGARAKILQAEKTNAQQLRTAGQLKDPLKHVYP